MTTKAKHLLVMAAGMVGISFQGSQSLMKCSNVDGQCLGLEPRRAWKIKRSFAKAWYRYGPTSISPDCVAKVEAQFDWCSEPVVSFFQCFGVMRRRQPSVVLGMGGYVTVPGGVSAALTGRPVVLMNADAPLLLSNKAWKPFAKKLMFGLPAQDASAQHDDAKSVFTGNPIRRDITALPAPAQRYAARSGVLRVLVVGGSLGAKALNECIPQAWAAMPVDQRPILTHQSGKATC